MRQEPLVPEELGSRMPSGWERRQRLTDALAGMQGSRAQFPGPEPLRDVLDAYVAERRAEGVPPERVLLEVKEMLGQLGFARRIQDESPSGRIVKWTLESYFGKRE